MILDKLNKKNLITAPNFVVSNTHYMVLMGSVAYGVSTDTSDQDIYGFCIPSKDVVFPHLDGEIIGFGKQKQRFEQWQQAHIKDGIEEYDFTIYSIVKYFNLCMENNPNMVDSLFVPQNYILHSTYVGNLVRESRKKFLHKGMWHKFKGYAYSMLKKAKEKNPDSGTKRRELIEKYGFDTKYCYHLVRLLSQAEQMLIEGDLDLQEVGRREYMKAIRRGDVSLEDIERWAADKEKDLEKLYHSSSLPWGPDENYIKQLLMNCLEHHYGSLENCVMIKNKEELALKEIKLVLEKYKV